LEFNQLESFISVVKHKSFSQAAKELYITQPTVSNNIQSLEKELNTTLLDRTSKDITLTEAGRKLYEFAVELINTRDKARHTIMDHSEKIEGEIEISASSIPEQYILPYIIKDFLSIYPDVSFSVNHKDSKNIVDDILEGINYFGMVGAKYCSDKLEYMGFYEDELVLAVPDNERYPWPAGEYVDIDVLYTEKLIIRKKGSGTRRLIEQRLSAKGIDLDDLNIVSLAESNEMIKKMIELGLGVSFVSEISIKNEVDLKLIKPLRIKDLNLERSFYFVHNKRRTLPPAVEAFRDFLSQWRYKNH
jgi:DNA-binding transcriptional LysR family regulator